MEENVFFNRFIMLLQGIQERYELESTHDALIMWFGEYFLYLDPDDIKQRIVKDSHAEGVDALLLNDKNLELVFVQARTVEKFENTKNYYSESDLKKTFDGIRLLLKSSYKGKITPELENLVDEYHDLDNTGDYFTRVVFLTLKQKPTDDKFIQSFCEDYQKIGVIFYDFNGMFELYKQYLTMRAPAPKRIALEVVGSRGLDKDSPIKSRVFTCKGKDIARIYSEHKETIFQQNVRYYLGAKSKSINRQITLTSGDKKRSECFWYFNNGITMVCTKIGGAATGMVVTLENAQIINGAQTTYALYDAFQNGTLQDNVEIIVKAIETQDLDFIESVTLYTNSQNAIRLRDLCSNDEIQRAIQQVLLPSYNYFYERKRGELDSLYKTVDEKTAALGKAYRKRLLSNENAAQAYLAMYLNRPAEAKNEKGRIFMKDKAGFYDDIFATSDGILAEKLLASWKLLKYIERKKDDYRKVYKKADALPEEEKNAIYRYDFLLHNEYFVLNIINDFLRNSGLDLNKTDDLIKLISMCDEEDITLAGYYETIKEIFALYMDLAKAQPKYYHNKFFKNETSIGIIRVFFKGKLDFIEVMPA